METILNNRDAFFQGIWTTIQLALASAMGAAVLGLILGVCRISPVPILRAAIVLYVEFVRSLPPPVIMVFLFFALPEVGLTLEAFVAATACFSIYHAAYVVEVIRSGVLGVPRGQIEAARALGLSYRRMLGTVVISQAVRTTVLPLGNIFVDLTKNTSIAYTIAVVEITGTASNLAARLAEPVPLFLAAGAAYLLMTIPLGALFRHVDRKVAIKR